MPRMRKPSGMSIPAASSGTSVSKMAAMIVGGIGLVFVAAGVLVFVLGTRSADADRARVEGLLKADAGALASLLPGTEVLVEGRIAASQPAVFRDFVAYERHERETGSGRSSSPSPRPWRWRERKTPALLIDVAGGSVWVRENYAMPGARDWYDPQIVDRIETRYAGLVVAERVLVVGRVVEREPAEGAPGADRPVGREIEAEIVRPGDRASYLDSITSGRTVSRWLGGGFTVLGGLMLALAGGIVLLGRRGAG
jgi:hypothetical protein